MKTKNKGVMNRGRRREKIFTTPKDYELFISKFQLIALCLMSYHYHLLLHTPGGNISRCMRHINGVYTQRFNRMNKKDGQLFQGQEVGLVGGLVTGDVSPEKP